jgi:hypothetical protein
MKAKAWSFSALNNFESCPKKYWHLSIEKDVKEEEGEAILYGKKVHKALELLVRDGTPLPQELAHMKPYVQQFIDADVTKLCEQQLAITADFGPTDWRDWSGAWCRAVIDLALVGDTHAVLIDYKTGKVKDDGFVQLSLAAVIFMVHHPKINVVDVGYLWTEAKGKVSKARYTRDQITEVWNSLLPRVGKFQAAYEQTNYPARPSGLCRNWCPVTACPHHGE